MLPLVNGCGLFEPPPPPMARLSNAQDALERALSTGALNYAESEYRQAEHLIAVGWREIGRQNGRIWFLRNYNYADSLLRRAAELADNSARQSQDKIADLAAQARDTYRSLEEELTQWREALNGTLIHYSAERWWSQAEMHLRTARRLIKDGEYADAMHSARMGKLALARVGAELTERANNEVTQIKWWRAWVEETVRWSEIENDYAIIVDKSAHKTYLIKGGAVFKTFASDLGYNSASQKYFAGDGATPEGKYHITKVKSGNSKFYKALLINFPNDDDKQRFAENKRRGIISHWARIGGLIEIHGDGGHGKDWTDGCVALSNENMDALMKYVGVGTLVTLVRRYDGNLLK
ncbi:MAG: hypothetical protein FJY65_02495 [Calditrichaeota bacterium]|nr:hypothetical protein [Calditrichota bacterium]